MDILGSEPASAPYNDLIAVLVPFEDRPRADTKLAADINGY